MIIFDEPVTAPYVGLAIGVVLFAVQLLICYKVKLRFVRYFFAGLLTVCWLFILLLTAGVFGHGTGLGNANLLFAAILSMATGGPSIGVAAAWVVYWVRQRKK